MPDTREDKAVLNMEADIRTMAARLGPIQEARERPKMASEPFRDPPGPVGAGAVGKRLEELLKRSQDLSKQALVLEIALAGPLEGGISPDTSPLKHARHPDAPLFKRQMAALDEIGAVMDSLGRSLERAQRALS
jgi:hypothetical protein